MNMSYCRFQTTLSDLLDCIDHMQDDDLSREEQRARARLLQECVELTDQYPDGLETETE